MSLSDWLKLSESSLNKADIATARLDCLVLLEDITGKDRGWLLAHPEFKLQIEQVKILNTKITQRAKHIPIAYIRSKTEFYGRELFINNNVLEPRPESEAMIDLLKQITSRKSELTICDVGTGSGALAITAKLEIPSTSVLASDIDEKCLEVASKNASQLAVDVSFYQGDLLAPLTTSLGSSSVLLCNLPYVPDNFTINSAAMNEPRLAIFGGPDGLDIYRRLFAQVKKLEVKPEYILAEAMPPQHDALAKIASASGCKLARTDDFIQLFRHSC